MIWLLEHQSLSLLVKHRVLQWFAILDDGAGRKIHHHPGW
jgi:hypothetical protein